MTPSPNGQLLSQSLVLYPNMGPGDVVHKIRLPGFIILERCSFVHLTQTPRVVIMVQRFDQFGIVKTKWAVRQIIAFWFVSVTSIKLSTGV